MKLKKIHLFIISVILLLLSFQQLFSQGVELPSVKITDHILPVPNTGIINIDCDYDFLPDKKIRLKADFPDLKQPNKYKVDNVIYSPIGNLSDGTLVTIKSIGGKEDDTYSAVIDLGFEFCFYGNKYTQVIISDNGIVSFNTVLAQGEAPYAPPTPLPSGLPKNSIFGVFHDMLNVNKVRYKIKGTYPNRRFIINYEDIPQYGYPISGKNSSSQIVLYETSNIIDVYVKDRFENLSTNSIFEGEGKYRKNAVIGLTNYDSSNGIVAPGRDSGNWEAHNEGWRFIPDGNTSHTIIWKNRFGSEISGTRNQSSILVQPSENTKYSVEVTYNLCTPITVKDEIEVKFSQDFPTANTISAKVFCVDNGDSYTVDLTQYESDINPDTSLSFSYFEDAALNTPISYPKTAYTFSNDKIVYVKVLKSGVCYTVGKIELKLNKKPVIPVGQYFEVCDTGNDEKEIIKLSNQSIFNFQGLSGTYYKFFETYAEAEAGTPEINKNTYNLDVTSEADDTKTLYIRAWRSSYNDSECYTIVPFKVKLKKYVVLKEPEEPFLICYVIEGQIVKDYDLTQYESFLLDFPNSGETLEYYTHPSCHISYKILDPTSATITMNATLYVRGVKEGYCDSVPVKIELVADDDCDGTPGGGGGGGPTGPGGGGGGGGPICDSNETEYTVELHQDYLRFYLIGGLALSDIDIIGFYDTNTGDLITNTLPYSYTFPVPFYKVIQARYKIKTTGVESFVNFPISASSQANIDPDKFKICDTYKEGLGKETVQLVSEYENIINSSYYNQATVKFFKTAQDRNDYNNNSSLNNNITQIELNSPLTTVYVWVKFFGCIYEHEIDFELESIIEKKITPSYVVCDFNDDKKEMVNLIEKTNNENDLKSPAIITPAQLVDLEIPIRYYNTIQEASMNYPYNYITDPENFEINASQMSVWARLEIDNENECPIFVEIPFEFTTSVALPDYKEELVLCDTDNDQQEMGVDLNQIINSIDPASEISFYTKKEEAEAPIPNIGFQIGGIYDGITPILYDVTVFPEVTIYIRIYDNNTQCVKALPVKITLIGYPEINNNIIEWCDYGNDGKEEISVADIQNILIANNSGILDNPPLMTYSFFDSETEAKDNLTTPLTSFTATNTNSVWVRIMKNVGDCPMIFELKFKLISSPNLVENELVYMICNNNTGNENGEIEELVNLDSYKQDILGFPPTNDYIFTYYNTNENDAINGTSTGQVSSSYTITSFPSSIWVRVEYQPTGCFSVKQITIDQYPSLEEDIQDTEIIACATGEMSKVIDLTDYPPKMILPHVNLSDFKISYHNSRANAVNNQPILSDITNYTVTPSSQVWIKFIDIRTGGNSCYIIKKIGVTIYSSPKVQDIYPEICDESDGVIDGEFVIPDLNVYRAVNMIITTPSEVIMPGESEGTVNTLYPFTFYKDINDAKEGNGNTVNNLNFTFNESELVSGGPSNPDYYELYARIDKTDNTGCYSIATIYFQIRKKVPIDTEEPIIVECDDSDMDGKTRFDLTTKSGLISSTGITFKYYTTKQDAQEDLNEIPDPTSVENPTAYEHIFYVRVQSPGYCDNIARIKAIVYPYINVVDHPDVEICEFESDGKTASTVDLTNEVDYMLTHINDLPNYPTLSDDLEITYHTSDSDAESTLNSIPSVDLSNYMVPVGITEIWVRFQSKTTQCYQIRKMIISKTEAPRVAPLEYLLCDDNLDEVYDILLSSIDTQVPLSPGNYQISYYETAALSETGTGFIDKTSLYLIPYTDFPKTLAVRIEDTDTGCVRTGTIKIITNLKVPIDTEEPIIVECDDSDMDGKTRFDLTTKSGLISSIGTTFKYYTTKQDAQEDLNEIPDPTSVENPTAYEHIFYVRVQSPGYCDNIARIKAVVYPYINVIDHPDVEICEFESDGKTATPVYLQNEVDYMLTHINDLPNYPTLSDDLEITYHTSESDAENLLNQLLSPHLPFYIPVGITEIWVRFQSKTTQCYQIRKMTISKTEAPKVAPLEYLLCDDNLDEVYDILLSSIDTQVPLSPGNYQISYYETAALSETGTGFIDKTSLYLIPYTDFPKTLAVRIEDTDTGCVRTGTIKIITNLKVPIDTEEPIIVECDDSDMDGKTRFDLTTKSGLISSIGTTFKYYTTKQDAQEDLNEIPDPTSVENPTAYEHIFYVRVQSPGYCDNIARIKAVVYPYINVIDHPDVEICEFESDGKTATPVYLQNEVDYMLTHINDLPNYPTLSDDLEITYHTSESDAENLLNQLLSPHLPFYIPVGITEIWVRFQSKTTQCYQIRKMTISKTEAPKVAPLEYLLCDDNLDEVYDILLSSIDTQVPLSPGNYQISYYETAALSETGTGFIDKTSLYLIPYTDFPKTLAVRIEDTDTGCVRTGTIKIVTNPKVIVNKEVELTACDGDNDGFAEFDLTLVASAISLESDISFTYYSSLEDAQKDQNPIYNFTSYTNFVSNQDYVYVRIAEDPIENNRCPSLAKIKLITYYPPAPPNDVVYICPKTTTTLDAGDDGYDSIRWFFNGQLVGEGQYLYNVGEIGVYTIEVTKILNYNTPCTSTFQIGVELLEEPVIIELQQGKDNITVIAKGPAPLEYSIDNVNWQQNNTFTNLKQGIYTFYVRSVANGCEAVTSKGIIFGVPNVITPNGDNYNDVWRLSGLDMFKGESSHIKIFDRYGKQVFEQTSNTYFIWDGKYLGRNLPTASYWYIITIADGREFTGWIMLRNYDESYQ